MYVQDAPHYVNRSGSYSVGEHSFWGTHLTTSYSARLTKPTHTMLGSLLQLLGRDIDMVGFDFDFTMERYKVLTRCKGIEAFAVHVTLKLHTATSVNLSTARANLRFCQVQCVIVTSDMARSRGCARAILDQRTEVVKEGIESEDMVVSDGSLNRHLQLPGHRCRCRRLCLRDYDQVA